MAYRFKNSQVFHIAKTALNQAKESIVECPSPLRPASRDLRQKEECCTVSVKGEKNSLKAVSSLRVQEKKPAGRVANSMVYCNYVQARINDNEKVLRNRGITRESPGAIMTQADISKFSNDKVEVNLVQVHNSIAPPKVNIETEVKEIDTAPIRTEKKCWSHSYSDILRGNLKREEESESFIEKPRGKQNRGKNESKMLDFRRKLSGTKTNISPMVVSGNFVSCRSISGVICSKEKPSRISKKKETSPRLFSDDPTTKPSEHTPMKALKKECISEKKEERCRRADDDWKFDAKPFSAISYTTKSSVELEMKPNTPLNKLMKVKTLESSKVCKPPEESYTDRSDANLIVSMKNLPSISTGEIGGITRKLDPVPLVRLKKIIIPEPQKICPEEIYEKKNYATYEVAQKKLRPLSSSAVKPPVFPVLKDPQPLKRLKLWKVEDRPKICPPQQSEESCERADEYLSIERKVLPKLSNQTIPSQRDLNSPPLNYLMPPSKVNDPQEPPKICPEEEQFNPNCRIDNTIPEASISLPKNPALCVPLKKRTYKEGVGLRRLGKIVISEPPKICHIEEIHECPKRADADKIITKRSLPKIMGGLIPKPESNRPPDDLKLKRLPKMTIKEPEKIRPATPIERYERLVDVPSKKKLPILPRLFLNPPDPPVFERQVFLKRLGPYRIEEPLKICELPKSEEKCVRADANVSMKWKQLRKLNEDNPMIQLKSTPPPLSSLKPPVKTSDPKEPLKVCPTAKYDPICRTNTNVELSKKSLPKIPALSRPPELKVSLEDTKLKRLKKVVMTEPLKIRPEEKAEIIEKTDSYQVVPKRSLPKMELNTLRPQIPYSIPTNVPLRRLEKLKLEEPRRTCPTIAIEECERLLEVSEKRSLPSIQRGGKVEDIFYDTERLVPKRIKEDVESCKQEGMFSKFFALEKAGKKLGHQRGSKGAGGKRSMSTNLTDYYTKGLLTRKMQSSHLDVRKRLSLKAKRRNHRKLCVHEDKVALFLRNFSDDPNKDLQPRNTFYTRFEGMAPIKPEAPPLDPEKEDDCIRKKCDIPPEYVTMSCENPNPKRKYLRVAKDSRQPCPPSGSKQSNTEVCDDVVKSCSSKATSQAPSSCSPPITSCEKQQSSNSSSDPPHPSSSLPPSHCCRCAKPLPPCPCCCPCAISCPRRISCPKPSLWQRVKNYFKARPNCPTPAQMKKRKAMKKIKKIADKAGLGVYDPCDDPKKICREVEKRCCLARQDTSSKRRCYHCYGFSRSFHTLSLHHYSQGLSSLNTRLMVKSYFISFFQLNFSRSIKNWRNPFDFYEVEDGDDTFQISPRKIKYRRDISEACQLNYSWEHIDSIDVDALRAIMCRCLKFQSIDASDSFRLQLNYLVEFSPECLEEKRDILVEILKVLSQQLSAKDGKVKEIDATDNSSKLQEDLAKMKTSDE